jgi:hypothetical protein
LLDDPIRHGATRVRRRAGQLAGASSPEDIDIENVLGACCIECNRLDEAQAVLTKRLAREWPLSIVNAILGRSLPMTAVGTKRQLHDVLRQAAIAPIAASRLTQTKQSPGKPGAVQDAPRPGTLAQVSFGVAAGMALRL